MSDVLAYHISFTTYGTWLPGDERGWVEADREGIQKPDPRLHEMVQYALAEEPFVLNAELRAIVDQAIRDDCVIRKWTLHALNVRTNHVHVVVSADKSPEAVMQEFKSWATRRLKKVITRNHFWTHHGSTKWIHDPRYLANTVRYVKEGQ